MNKDLGKKLKQLRMELGVTQAQLAQRLGVTVTRISHMEAGRVSQVDTIQKYAKGLGRKVVIDLVRS